MKSLLFFSVVTAILINGLHPALSQELNEWQNPKLTGSNNVPPHATMVICPDAKTARSIRLVNNHERVKSLFYRSLNGDWKYHYAANFSERLSGVWQPSFD